MFNFIEKALFKLQQVRSFFCLNMAEKLELYERLKACRTSLKGSVTRKLRRLSGFSKHELLNKTAFEQCDASLQLTLNNLRSTLKLVSELTFELLKQFYEKI